MNRRFLSVLAFLFAGALLLRAQDHPTQILDGPVVKADSLQTRPELLPRLGVVTSPGIQMPSILAPMPFETKEERAARINAATKAKVSKSISDNLVWYRPPHLSTAARSALFVAGLFLSNPYGFRSGYVPLMNHSFPFITAAVPGKAPYESPYSPDKIPQAIRLEYDFATGTYKQVMVPWSEVQKKMSRSFGGAYQSEAVPRIAVTPVEREMMSR